MDRGIIGAIYFKLNTAYLMNEREIADSFLGMLLDEGKRTSLKDALGSIHHERLQFMRESLARGRCARFYGNGASTPDIDHFLSKPEKSIAEAEFHRKLMSKDGRIKLFDALGIEPWADLVHEVEMEPYGRCVDIESRIWTPSGYKLLKDLKCGDRVYSFDGERAIVSKVVAKKLSGIRKTLLIKTRHRSIRVTLDHPLLVVPKNNFIKKKFFVDPKKRQIGYYRKRLIKDRTTKKYVLAGKLIRGDQLILPCIIDSGKEILVNRFQTGDIWGSRSPARNGKRMVFPLFVDADLSRLMGFLLGDGWTAAHDTHLCFAEGEYPEINEKYINIIKSYGYKDDVRYIKLKDKEYGYFEFLSAELARTMALMGLVGRCWQKRIPEWVYSARNEIKSAFIEGLVDSDGWIRTDKRWGCTGYSLEVTSKGLVEDLKVLLDQMNIKCGMVGTRQRENKSIWGRRFKPRRSWYVNWSSKMSDSQDYMLENILSIEDGGEIEVGDIQVDSQCHNIIPNGIVAHNCDFLVREGRTHHVIEVKAGGTPSDVVSQIDRYRIGSELEMTMGLHDRVTATVIAERFSPYVAMELSRLSVRMVTHCGTPESLRLLGE
jgi:hypothetical protein